MEKMKILFICTHNSARSQMAEGLVNALYSEQFEAFSAGTEVAEVRSQAIQVMKEMGIDLSHHYSKNMRTFYGTEFDLVATVCDNAKKVCPVFPGAKKMIHQSFLDPSTVVGTEEEKLLAFRRARDLIHSWIKERIIPNFDNL
jgi:arsenate reductase